MNGPGSLFSLILRRQATLGLSPQETLILLHLVDLGGMQVTVSQADLARRLNLSRRQVSQTLASLLQRGLLSTTPTLRRDGGKGPNIYDLEPFLLTCGGLGAQ